MAEEDRDEKDSGEVVTRDRALENTMRKTMDGIRERENKENDVSSSGESAQPPEPGAGAADAGGDDGTAEKTRDVSGRFKGKTDKAAEAPVEKSLEGQGADESKPEQPQAKAQAATQAPSSWSNEAKAVWNDLPPVVRAQALKREQDISRVVQQGAERLKRAESIEKIIEPHKGLLSKAYSSPEAGVTDLLNTFQASVDNPLGFAAWFLQTRGIDPRQLLGVSQGGAANAPPQDPAMAALLNKVNGLEGKLTEKDKAEEARLTELAAQSWESFASDPKNRFIEEVRQDMLKLIENGLAGSYQEAYDKSVRLRDDLFEQTWQEKQAEQAKARQVEQEKQAKDARKAATIANVTRPNAGATPSQPKSWEETLRDKNREIQGRVA